MASQTSQQPAKPAKKTFELELVDAPPFRSRLTRLPARRQREIKERMEHIVIRPEARIAAKLSSFRITTWQELVRWMQGNDGKATEEKWRALDDELVEHYFALLCTGFQDWPEERQYAVTGFERGYRNPWGPIPKGWFDMEELREDAEDGDAEMVERKGEGEGEKDLGFGPGLAL